MNKIRTKLFGGDGSEQYNVLLQALENCAKKKGSIYKYLETTAKTSLVVQLVDEINNLGFNIKI